MSRERAKQIASECVGWISPKLTRPEIELEITKIIERELSAISDIHKDADREIAWLRDWAGDAVGRVHDLEAALNTIKRHAEINDRKHGPLIGGFHDIVALARAALAAPAIPVTATKPEPLPGTEGRCHFYYGKEGGYCYSAAGDPCPSHGGVSLDSHSGDKK